MKQQFGYRAGAAEKFRKSMMIVLLLVAGISSAQAWWNDKWSAAKQMTVDASITGADINGTLVDFPVLVRLHSGNFGFFLDLAEGGRDIRFIGNDKLPMNYHIDRIDPINELAYIWVKVPQIAGGTSSEPMWMYYGNTEAVAGEDQAGTYGVNQTGVYHFGDVLEADATGYQNNAGESGAVADPAGFIGSAARFRGSDRMVLGPSESLTLSPETGWSFSAWIKQEVAPAAAAETPAPAGGDAVIMQAGNPGGLVELLLRNGAVVLRAETSEGNAETPARPLAAGTWEHVSADYNGTRLALFAAGTEVGGVDVTLPAIPGTILLGAGADGRNFTGLMDEVQISNVSRAPDWIKALASSQGVDSTVLSFGQDEQIGSGGGTSYFTIILSNVSVDGWVIIGLLSVMLLVSLIVMVSKVVVISRIKKDNRSFINRFRHLGSSDPESLDLGEIEEDEELEDSAVLMALFGTHDDYSSSSLYQIYHAGMHEIRQRKGNALTGLSPEALAVVRVHLDSALVTQYQRLNKQMVLLTIAISGGPFLGLLGTVMGVMITFAAIAATGDVNISAIAPGVSAALMTTVAGLAVAIPCLFGYNYLATQIKEMTAEMRIFVDEFIHQVGEKTKA